MVQSVTSCVSHRELCLTGSQPRTLRKRNFPLGKGGGRISLKVLTEPSYREKTTCKCLCKKVFISEPKPAFASSISACVHFRDLLRDVDEAVKGLKLIHGFFFFPQGNCPKVSSINDRNDWKVVRKALTVIGFNEDEVEVKTWTHTHTPAVGAGKSQQHSIFTHIG